MLALHEFIGITGLIIESIAAYFLRNGYTEARSWTYLLVMFSGCAMHLYTLSQDWNLVAFIANAIWLIYNGWCILRYKIFKF